MPKDLHNFCINGFCKFFRRQILTLSDSEILALAKDYENLTKQIKYNTYKLAWYMRGSFSYEDMMCNISVEDKEIINTIINENLDTTAKTQLPFI